MPRRLLLVLLVLSGACGTRVDRAATEVPAANLGAGNAAAPVSAVTAPGGAPQVATTGSVGASPAVTPTTRPPGRADVAAGGAASSAGGTSPTTKPAAATAQPQDAGTGPSSGDPAAQPRVPGSPILFGNVSTTSGPAGKEGQHLLQATQLWAKWINSRGGLGGHPVSIIAADDGGDPARRKAVLQEMIEQRRVLALVNNWESLTGAATVDYVTQKRVPVVGLSGGEYWAYQSPMYFPQASVGGATEDSMFAGLGEAAGRTGRRKLAVFFCAEAQACQNYSDKAPQADRYGLRLVYRAKVSLAQPDFTAECLSAANAGAEVVFVASDPNSLRRIAASCRRQGYDFTYATGLQVVQDGMKDDQNLDGRLLAMSNTFPYFQADTPATKEFQGALKAFGPGLELSGMLSAGWVTGKLLEKAAARMPDPPTTAGLLAGLWSVRDDDLGGLTQPLTFTTEKPPTPVVCWFTVTLDKGTWLSPDRFARHCL